MVGQKRAAVYAIVAVGIVLVISVLEYEKNTTLQLQHTLANFKNYSIVEFKLPSANASPLFPSYDKTRNVIWVGDIKPNSSRIWEFELDSKTFVEHHLNGTSIITTSFLDSDGTLWYVDPYTNLLGHYDPSKNTNKLIKIPTNGTISGIVVDLTGKVWIDSPSLNEILRYDVQRGSFTTIFTPTSHASPLAIGIDNKSGYVWIDEAIGQIAKLDPLNYKITEFKPSGGYSLKLPVAIKIDSNSGTIYIAEHGEDAIFAFYPENNTFSRLALHPDPEALPYGMSFDREGNIWIAQHTVNKIAVLDPKTGESAEITIPTTNSLTQWITSDSKGNIWIAEPGGAALGVVTEG